MFSRRNIFRRGRTGRALQALVAAKESGELIRYTEYDFIIGIDPGKNNGFAVWDSRKKAITHMDTLNFFDLLDELKTWQGKSVFVRVEDPRQNKPVFDKQDADTKRKQLRVAQNVGMNKKDAENIIEYCKKIELKHEAVQPKEKKWTQEVFTRRTGITKRVSQHIRDAARLIWRIN